jgi:hypothetical protein
METKKCASNNGYVEILGKRHPERGGSGSHQAGKKRAGHEFN